MSDPVRAHLVASYLGEPVLRPAVMAVLDLHVSTEIEHPRRDPWCEQDGRTWPCPTVKAIADALGVTL